MIYFLGMTIFWQLSTSLPIPVFPLPPTYSSSQGPVKELSLWRLSAEPELWNLVRSVQNDLDICLGF